MYIRGVEFHEPAISHLAIDMWQARIEFVVGEADVPYSTETAPMYMVIFRDVVEVRCFRDPLQGGSWQIGRPYFTEELTDFGEREAQDQVSDPDGQGLRLRAPAFRNEAKLGYRWKIDNHGTPRLVYMGTWLSYLEFLYQGESSIRRLSSTETIEEWRRHWQNYRR